MPNKKRCRCSNPIPKTGFGSLGADKQTTIQLTSAGAKAGSYVPVVGTAIGAAIGFVASKLIKTGQKPQRAAAAAQLEAAVKANPAGFVGRNMSHEDLGHIWYMLIINNHMYGWQKSNPKDHPSAMDAFYYLTRDMGKELVQRIASTPVGSQQTQTFRVAVNGVSFDYTYTNPGCTNVLAISKILQGMQAKFCAVTNPAANCNTQMTDPVVIFAFNLLTDKLVSENCPTAPVAPTVITSAPAPIARPPVATVPVTAPRNTGIVPPGTVNTPVPTAVTPGNVTATPSGVDLNAMVSQLLAQGASQQQAYASALQSLQAQGIQPTAAVQGQVAQAVQTAGGVSGLPTWLMIGAGVLALGFALAVPARRGARRAMRGN
jgi:hypothetical protein